jgi:hypothetical protein
MIRPPLSNESPLTGGWTTLDVSTGCGDYLVAQTKEICDVVDDYARIALPPVGAHAVVVLE